MLTLPTGALGNEANLSTYHGNHPYGSQNMGSLLYHMGRNHCTPRVEINRAAVR